MGWLALHGTTSRENLDTEGGGRWIYRGGRTGTY